MKKQFLQFALVAMTAVTVLFSACKTDPCKDIKCQNSGTCDSGVCLCTDGYEGTNCETLSRGRFLVSGSTATWTALNGADGCYTPGYTSTIAASSAAVNIVNVSNFAGYGTGANVQLKVKGKTFTNVASVTAGATVLSDISGTINDAGTSITVSYKANDGTTPLSCSATWTKQ